MSLVHSADPVGSIPTAKTDTPVLGLIDWQPVRRVNEFRRPSFLLVIAALALAVSYVGSLL